MTPEFPKPMESFGTGYWKIVAALSRRSTQGHLLLLSTATVALVTGAIVLFVDMPSLPMGILSVVSLAALIFFVAGARARFFPASDRPVKGTPSPVFPDDGKGTKTPAMLTQ